MNNHLTDYFKQQSFQPGFFSIFTNPFFIIRRSYFKNIKTHITQLKGKLLDFGCGRKPFENLFSVDEYIGVDVQHSGHNHRRSKVDVYYDGRRLPFNDESFDSVFSSEVLEHIFNPDEILPELNRVMKKGGLLLITVPFSWNEHETPFDYARYSSFGIRHLLEKHGFSIREQKKTGNFARVMAQHGALYFFELFREWGRAGYLLSLIFIVPINLIGSLLLPLFPKNDSLYFTNIVLAEKIGGEQQSTV